MADEVAERAKDHPEGGCLQALRHLFGQYGRDPRRWLNLVLTGDVPAMWLRFDSDPNMWLKEILCVRPLQVCKRQMTLILKDLMPTPLTLRELKGHHGD